FLGSASTKRYSRGRLKRAMLSRQSWSSSSVGIWFLATTKATTSSPHSACGRPTTEHSAMAGWRSSTYYISRGLMFEPPERLLALAEELVQVRAEELDRAQRVGDVHRRAAVDQRLQVLRRPRGLAAEEAHDHRRRGEE